MFLPGIGWGIIFAHGFKCFLGGNATIHHPDTSGFPLSFDALKEIFECGFVLCVSWQHFTGQWKAFGCEHKGDDHLNAFGIKLGGTVPKDLILPSSVNSLGFTEIKFNPKHTLDPLTDYTAVVTPEDGEIWILIGTANLSKESDLLHYSDQFRKLVAAKYGEMKPINDTSSIESRWQYSEAFTKRSISVAFKRIGEALLMTYEDLNLHEQAEEELLNKKSKELDSSAFRYWILAWLKKQLPK